jgi:hypothetical protein
MKVEIDGGRTAFRPGEEVRGVVSWSLDESPTGVELRLFWRTEGKGIPDVGVVETVGFDGAGRADRREFRVRLPDGPYSFTGQLVSLIWAVEVVAEPGGAAASQDLVLSPTGNPIVLSAL